MSEDNTLDQKDLDFMKEAVERSMKELENGFIKASEVLAFSGCPPEVAQTLINEMTKVVMINVNHTFDEILGRNSTENKENLH